MSLELGLVGKSAIVTGASRGIGAGIALALAAEGVNLALIARGAQDLETTANAIRREQPVRVLTVAADVADGPGLVGAMSSAIEFLGGVNILINNAGASPFGSLDKVTDDDWLTSFQTKVLGYVRATRGVLPTMRHQKEGTIINIVGMAGRYATPTYTLGAHNAALLHLTRSTASLLAAEGIRVLAVNPALTATERSLRAIDTWAEEAGVDREVFHKRYVTSLPLGRLATVEEVAKVVIVAVSDVGAYMTGSAIQIDGGAPLGVF